MATHRDTVPLPLALHLALHSVVGLFCAFAGALNVLDPLKIFPNAVLFFLVCGFSWGYVFGTLMGRREVLILGWAASGAYIGLAGWQLGLDPALAALLAGIGFSGVVALGLYRRWVLAP
jgi:hypothetical protein